MAAGAATGVGVDLLVGGITLGAAAALGAVLGGSAQTLRNYGQRLKGKLKGQRELTVDDAVLRLLALRQQQLLEPTMDTNLETLSLRELKDLQAKVARAIATYEDRKKKEALAELEEKAREMGFTLAELMAIQAAKAPRKRTPTVAKYANPADPSDTWSGRGRKPNWFIHALAAGRTPEEMAV